MVSVCSVDCFGGGDSLESDRWTPRRPFLLTLRRVILSRFSGGGDELFVSDSGGSARRESPRESRDPLIGVGTILTRFDGMCWFGARSPGETEVLPTDCPSSESTSAIRNSADAF